MKNSKDKTGNTDLNDPSIDQTKLKFLMQNIRDNQNFSMALITGFAAALLGAIIWASITYLTGFQIGWMAVGIGFMVGYTVRIFGRGIDLQFQIGGAVLSLFGCLLGNLLTVCIFVAESESISFFELLSLMDISLAFNFMTQSFQIIDLLFYGIAVYEGFRFSLYRLSEEELARVIKPQPNSNKETKEPPKVEQAKEGIKK